MPPLPKSWADRLDAVRRYVESHEGKLPSARRPNATALGHWVHSERQRLGLGFLSTSHARQFRELLDFAEETRAQILREAGRAGRAKSARLASRRAAPAAVRKARKALSNPYLVPGDTELLQLRIDHPDATLTELAELAGTTPTAFKSKFQRALKRTAASRPRTR